MSLSPIGVDAYIASLQQVQREIIATALHQRVAILPIPIGLQSHVVALAIAACFMKARASSCESPGKHVLPFEPLLTNQLKASLDRLPIRWHILSSGPLHDGLNLVPVTKIERFADHDPVQSIVLTNSTLAHLGAKRLPIVERMVKNADRWCLIANGGVRAEATPKLQLLFGNDYSLLVTDSIEAWLARLRELFAETSIVSEIKPE